MLKIFFIFVFFFFLQRADALGCYECSSGGAYPQDSYCESGSRYAGYQYNCMPRDGGGASAAPGTGMMASYCVKVVGVEGDGTQGGRPVVMRGCSTNFRTECKDAINFNGRTVRGCIYSCNSGEFCNSSHSINSSILLLLSTLLLFAVLKLC